MNKAALLSAGAYLMAEFCARNTIPVPELTRVPSLDWRFSACAYYRKDSTYICLERCSSLGISGAQWSCPGYTVDRTPYGVLQHELGHHADYLRSKVKGPYFGDFSVATRGYAGEAPITTYCPNDAEWFAECFRLFVTNPDLLRLLRPRTYRELTKSFVPVFKDTWRERMAGSPARTIAAAERKIETARSHA